MKFSVITPVHRRRADILNQTAASLRRQTCQDFEWVLLLNNEALDWDLRGVALPPKTRIFHSHERTNSIGRLKRAAFMEGVGEWLVELDWDDILTDDCLAVLADHAPGADFLHSNTAYFRGNFRPCPLPPQGGWVQRPFDYEGHALLQNVAFDVNPSSILWVGYSADHVRAWRRDFYHAIGGHHRYLAVADDHELILRTWMNNGVTRRIDQCLYLYRDEDNTVHSPRAAEIMDIAAQNHLRYMLPVMLKWSRDQGLLALDLCGGHHPEPGFLSVDLEGGDITADLNEPWPWPDSSVGVIRAVNAFEHLQDKQHVMRETHRVLAHGGFLLTITPSVLGQGGWQDPTHVSGWVMNSFLYYTDAEYARMIRNTNVRFVVRRHVESISNGVPYVHFQAQALKDGPRFAGPRLI